MTRKPIHKNEEIKRHFLQVDKILMENPKYEKMSEGAILAYSLLRDRLDISKLNSEVYSDEEGYLYLIYTDEELGEILHRTKKTANTRKKELVKYDLLLNVQMGNNQPNRLYLYEPETCDPEEYISNQYRIKKAKEREEKQKEKTVGNLGAVRESKNYSSGNVKITLPGGKNLHPSNTEVIQTESIQTDINHINMLPIVNKESEKPTEKESIDTTAKQDLTDICNELYAEFAPGRWNKKEWLSIIDRFVSGLIKNGMHFAVHRNRWKSYIYNAINKIAYNHDKKNNLIESPAANPSFNEKQHRDTSFYYNWLNGDE